jgi:hypothetical protein
MMKFKVKRKCGFTDYETADSNFQLSTGRNVKRIWQTLGYTKYMNIQNVSGVGVYLHNDGSIHVVVV